MAERLRRLERIYIRYPIYFITSCTYDRKPLLANNQVNTAFQHFSRVAMEKNIFVGGYVLMPDYLHLFVSLPDQALSSWMKSLKNSLSKKLSDAGELAPHWQRGFFDHILRSSESYSEKWRYMVENPVRAGLAKRWEDWPWRGEIFPLSNHV